MDTGKLKVKVGLISAKLKGCCSLTLYLTLTVWYISEQTGHTCKVLFWFLHYLRYLVLLEYTSATH